MRAISASRPAATIDGNFLTRSSLPKTVSQTAANGTKWLQAGLGYNYRPAETNDGSAWSSSMKRSIKALSANGSPLYSVFHVNHWWLW